MTQTEEFRGHLFSNKHQFFARSEEAIQEYDDLTLLQELNLVLESWPELFEGLPTKEQSLIGWRIIGFPLFAKELLDNHSLPFQERIRFIYGSANVTKAIPSLHSPGEPMEGAYFMWWHCIAKRLQHPDLVQACYEVLLDLTKHEDARVQVAALHGLGHLDHPGREAAVDAYIALHPEEQSNPWINQCRDGSVM